LAVLIEWCAIAAQRGVALRFSGFPDRLMRLAEMSEVDTLLLSER
jgi:ABC-type transporter Mla MlaB component